MILPKWNYILLNLITLTWVRHWHYVQTSIFNRILLLKYPYSSHATNISKTNGFSLPIMRIARQSKIYFFRKFVVNYSFRLAIITTRITTAKVKIVELFVDFKSNFFCLFLVHICCNGNDNRTKEVTTHIPKNQLDHQSHRGWICAIHQPATIKALSITAQFDISMPLRIG